MLQSSFADSDFRLMLKNNNTYAITILKFTLKINLFL